MKLGRLLTLLLCCSTFVFAQHLATRGEEGRGSMGSVEINVIGSQDEPVPYTVVIESGEVKREVSTDARGNLTLKLPPAIYTAYVKPRTSRSIRSVPFLVEGGGRAMIELDPTSEYVYCTSSGERVILVAGNDFTSDKKGLHSPRYDSFPVKLSNNRKLDIVVEFCGRIQRSNGMIQYQSAKVGYNDIRIFADNVLFDSLRRKLEGWGRVDLLSSERAPINPSRVEANFSHGKPVVSWTGNAIPSIESDGNVGGGKASFTFKLDGRGTARFEYQDNTSGLRLRSRRHDAVFIASASTQAVTFSGAAELVYGSDASINYDAPINATGTRIVFFTVVLRDNESDRNLQNAFSISIPTLKYNKSGPITSGDIKLGSVPNNDKRVIAGVNRH